MTTPVTAFLTATLMVFSAGATSAAPANAQSIEGEVIERRGLEVRVALHGEQFPRFGDTAELFEEVPGVGPVSVTGAWTVIDVTPDGVTLSTFDPGVDAKAGHKVRIATSRPRSASQLAADWEIYRSASRGDAATIRRAVDAGLVPDDIRGEIGRTALGIAAAKGHLEVMSLLLDAGADPNARAAAGISTLMIAAEDRDGLGAAKLIDAGADVHATAPGIMDFTALHQAASVGSWRTMGVLARAGADIDARLGDTPPPNAERNQNRGATPLFLAIEGNSEAAVAALVALGADPNATNADGLSAAEFAAQNGMEIPDRDTAGFQMFERLAFALENAISYGSAAEVELLLSIGAPPVPTEFTVYSPLTTLIKNPADGMDMYQAATSLLDAGALIEEPGEDGMDPLQHAAAIGDADLVRLFLERDAPVNAQIPYGFSFEEVGYTALMFAVREGHLDVVELLIGAQANPALQNDKEQTALDLAPAEVRAQVEQLLR